MSIASEITRIQNVKAALKTAINAKGGTLTTETIDDYAAAVSALPSGSGMDDLEFFDWMTILD